MQKAVESVAGNSSVRVHQFHPNKGLKMEIAMVFEMTMRILFGDKAYHIAGAERHPTHRRNWLQKATRKLMRNINDLDTTLRHKQMLMAEAESISKLLKAAKEPSWGLIYRFFRLTSRLLGYDSVRGMRCHSLLYWQSPEQYYTAHYFKGGDVMQNYYDQKDAISIRRSIVEDLKSKGFDDFKISMVLNTSEYEVKRLRPNPKLKRTSAKATQVG